MGRLWTVCVDGLSFEVPAEGKDEAAAKVREILADLPFAPVFEIAEPYTWTSFALAPKEDE